MKKFLLVMVALILSAVAVGQNRSKMNVSTLQFLKEQQSEAWRVKKMSQQETEAEHQYVDCFIRYSQPCEDALEALGVHVMVDLDGIMTARVPVAAMDNVAALEAVTSLNISEEVKGNSDVARAATHVLELQNGIENGLPLNYDGTGVVLGVIDGGIDFSHPAFRTADGHSRFSAVYVSGREPAPGTPAVVVDGKVIPGVLYVNKSDLDTLTYDTKNDSHGTHVLGIAAGRNIGPYGGVAPGVDLVACSLEGWFTTSRIVNAVAFLVDYAKKVGKPLVISKSLGRILGPHDGTSDLVTSCDKLLGENVIMCNSSGNNGNDECYIHMDGSNVHQYDNRYYHAFMARPWKFASEENKEVTLNAHLCCEDNKPFDIAFIHWDPTRGAVVTKFLKYEDYFEDGQANVKYTVKDAGYSISAYGQVSATNNKFYATFKWTYETNNKVLESATGVMIYPRDKNQAMHLWFEPDDGYLMSNADILSDVLTLENASTALSTNDECSSPKVISVGNFVSRLEYPIWMGTLTSNVSDQNPVGSIANNSSYGTMLNGIKTPVVCGPGATIVAPVNHYDSSYDDEKSAQKLTVDGRDYYWSNKSGTSMSTPHVAGIVALWLQANPRLTHKDILDVLAKTSIPCDKPQEKERWGQYGRIDALAGLKYILQTTDIRSMEAEDALLWTDVYNMNGQLLRKRVAVEKALEGLPAGIYVAGGKKVVVKK